MGREEAIRDVVLSFGLAPSEEVGDVQLYDVSMRDEHDGTDYGSYYYPLSVIQDVRKATNGVSWLSLGGGRFAVGVRVPVEASESGYYVDMDKFSAQSDARWTPRSTDGAGQTSDAYVRHLAVLEGLAAREPHAVTREAFLASVEASLSDVDDARLAGVPRGPVRLALTYLAAARLVMRDEGAYPPVEWCEKAGREATLFAADDGAVMNSRRVPDDRRLVVRNFAREVADCLTEGVQVRASLDAARAASMSKERLQVVGEPVSDEGELVASLPS